MALNALNKSNDEVIYIEKEEFKIMLLGVENLDFNVSFIEFKISVGVLQGGVFYMVKYISKQN